MKTLERLKVCALLNGLEGRMGSKLSGFNQERIISAFLTFLSFEVRAEVVSEGS